MNMLIYPKHMEETLKSGWIVKFLRGVGVLQVIGCIVLGVLVGGPYVAVMLTQTGVMSSEAAGIPALLIGAAVGIIAGLWTSLAFFALAQVIDDLHAMRIQTGAYVAIESDDVRLGK